MTGFLSYHPSQVPLRRSQNPHPGGGKAPARRACELADFRCEVADFKRDSIVVLLVVKTFHDHFGKLIFHPRLREAMQSGHHPGRRCCWAKTSLPKRIAGIHVLANCGPKPNCQTGYPPVWVLLLDATKQWPLLFMDTEEAGAVHYAGPCMRGGHCGTCHHSASLRCGLQAGHRVDW